VQATQKAGLLHVSTAWPQLFGHVRPSETKKQKHKVHVRVVAGRRPLQNLVAHQTKFAKIFSFSVVYYYYNYHCQVAGSMRYISCNSVEESRWRIATFHLRARMDERLCK
jgi:hypothetical protein